MPAILKGWFDRVLVCGWAFDAMTGQMFANAGLLNKKAWFVTSTGSPSEWFSPSGYQGQTLQRTLHHVTWSTLLFCGLEVIETFACEGVHSISPEQREESLGQLRQRVANLKDQPILHRFSGDSSVNLGLILPYHPEHEAHHAEHEGHHAEHAAESSHDQDEKL